MSKPNIYDETFSYRMRLIAENSFKSNFSEFARAVGVAQASLSRWVHGEADPSRSNLIKIAEVTGVTIEWLATGKEPADFIKTQEKPIALVSEKNINDEYIDIIDYRDVAVSAGFGTENGDYVEHRTVKVEIAWLKARRLKAGDCAMFRVGGNSMSPTLKDDEEIIVDRSRNELKEGRIFVINHGGTMWVKKIQITFDGVELISDNPEYKPISLNQDEANNLIVIGQVVRGYRDF